MGGSYRHDLDVVDCGRDGRRQADCVFQSDPYAEAILAAVIAVAMVFMVGATAVWWGAMAKDAPAFLNASPGGVPGSPWDIWLVATVALMAVAMTTAAVGVVREARVWRRIQVG